MTTGEELAKEFWLVRALRRPGKWWWILAPGFLIVLVVVSYLLQEWIGASGNVASIVGLVISGGGIVLTIWAVLETQRIDREAKAQLQQSVQAAREQIAAAQTEMQRQLEEARKETRDALGKVRTALYLTDCREAYDLAKHARDAIRARQWGPARDMCEAMRRACLYIIHSGLAEADVQHLKQALTTLPLLLTTLTQYESEKPKVEELMGKQSQWEPLDGIKFVLETIDARNRSQVLEVPHGGQPSS